MMYSKLVKLSKALLKSGLRHYSTAELNQQFVCHLIELHYVHFRLNSPSKICKRTLNWRWDCPTIWCNP